MEGDIKLRVCRLCFNIISDANNFLFIKDSLEDMLKVITTVVNVDKTSNPVMCNKCSKMLQEIFTFKTNFFESEEKIEAKISTLNNVKLDLSDKSSFRKRLARNSKRINIQETRVCRTCLKVINKKKFIDLNSLANSRLSSILNSCVPEMDLNITKNPIMCQICYDALQKMEYFKSLCNINESKIDAFSRTVRSDPLLKINLYEVLHFSKNHSSIYNAVTKLNEHTSDERESTNALICKSTKMEPSIDDTEKYLKVDCLEYVSVKMEPCDDEQVAETKICLKRRNVTNRSRSGTRKKTNNKCDNKNMICCSDCNFKTKYKHNLRRHLIIAHKRKDIEVNKKFYQCEHCSFSTKWNIDLTRHSLSHVKPEALKCTKCPYSTNQNAHLINHILTHVNDDSKDKHKKSN
ncbi:zinc finger protein 160-like [Anoplophora glabripennis]|uniref:zinc finger protein 160-like n=1 Tax=Anoplophora glabripennis TaxID=217634 RepID=UPI0008739221|nr:zinc finger protein 160-like [Anoplophora glabripennis]